MALRKIGRRWYIYYRDTKQHLHTLATGETSRERAAVKEQLFMSQLASEKRRPKGLPVSSADATSPLLDNTLRRPRQKLENALETYRKYYGEPATATRKYFNRFCRSISLRYMDEVTKYVAFEYLDETYSEISGRSFNEAKCSLNVVFKKLLIQSGLDESPFARIANRPHKGNHWRSVSDAEICALLNLATPGQHAAITIAYYTGLRKSSIYALKWDDLRCDKAHSGYYFWHLPPKTARFNRHIEIPVNEELRRYLATLPRVNKYIMGFVEKMRSGASYYETFGQLFDQAGIFSDERGIASFGSLRKNFIERCDAAGLRRSATRGIVGQIDDQITDIYSSDYAGALKIREFKMPRVKTKLGSDPDPRP